MANHGDWRQALQGVLNPQAPAPENPLVRAIEEFVAELNKSEWVHAALRPGPVPQVKTLVTGPKIRRDQHSLMLSFWVQNEAVRVVGQADRELRTPEEVLEFLTKFATETSFPTTVAEYKEICRSDTLGWLELEGRGAYDVVLPPDSQRKLADRGRSETQVPFDVDFCLAGEAPPEWKDVQVDSSVWPSSTRAAVVMKTGAGRLESGGFEMRVMGVRALGGSVFRAHGDVIR